MLKQNTYWPNRFYLTFPHDNSWNFDKILNAIKKLTFTFLYKYMIFFLIFCWLYSAFFFLNYRRPFWLTVNKCAITIIINIKSFLERHFSGTSMNSFWKKIYFHQKAVLHTTTPMHSKGRETLRNLYSTNQGNSSEIAFALKINLKNLKKAMIGWLDAGNNLKASIL